MSLEQKGRNTYYYTKERVGSKVRSRYIGKVDGEGLIGQILLDLDESCRRIKAMEKQQQEAEIALIMLQHNDRFASLDEVLAKNNQLIRAILLVTGHHQPKGQWRLRRQAATTVLTQSNTGEIENMATTELGLDSKSKEDLYKTFERIRELAEKATDPNDDSLRALRTFLRKYPEVLNNQPMLSTLALNAVYASDKDFVANEIVKVNVQRLKEGLGWANSSTMGKMLIDSVVLSYVKWSLAELNLASYKGNSAPQAQYYREVIQTTHKQFLRAMETMAKVRKLCEKCPEIDDFTQDQSLVM